MSRIFASFIAGAVAVLLFHQGMLTILQVWGFSSRAPFSIQPTPPLGIPQIWSTVFWGGLWGIVFLIFERRFPKGAGYFALAILFGAVGPSLVAWFIVAPIKAQPLAFGWKPIPMITSLIVNAAWGLGTALFLRSLSRK